MIELITADIQGPKLAIELGASCSRCLLRNGPSNFWLISTRSTYFSSTGFAVLFRLATEAKKKGIEVKFCGMDGAVAMGASIVGLEKVTEIHELGQRHSRLLKRPEVSTSTAVSFSHDLSRQRGDELSEA